MCGPLDGRRSSSRRFQLDGERLLRPVCGVKVAAQAESPIAAGLHACAASIAQAQQFYTDVPSERPCADLTVPAAELHEVGLLEMAG